MIDSHCHLAMPEFDADRGAVLARARASGVTGMIDVGIAPGSWERSLELAQHEPDVWVALGLHPNEVQDAPANALAQLSDLLTFSRVVAIGETGLDYHWQRTPRDLQVAAFAAQLDLARRFDLPVVVHCRDAYDDVLELLATDGYGTRGVLHCFGGTRIQAERAITLGYVVSFAGPLTFKNAGALREVAARLPSNAVLVETDAPFLSPHPLRGQRNEPARVMVVAESLARTRGLEIATIRQQTTDATRSLFRLPDIQ